ncbi:MAG: TauD/TfdA family dioxygenase [Myxococcota bacterium]|nr:TauD/TfdA family dioxygenase [Myxococcota bacterium]
MKSPQWLALESEGLVRVEPHAPGSEFLLVIRPSADEPSLLEWAVRHREPIRELLLQYGAILFRGFGAPSAASDFERFIEATGDGELLAYTHGSTPRESVSGRISTATIYPPDRPIPLHNEQSYSRSWPLKLWLFCHRAAAHGGATPLADSRRVHAAIDPRIRERFAEKGVMYLRNYGELIDVPWQQAFLTDDRSRVEDYCHEQGIEFEWLEGNGLRTRQVCQSVAEHPETGETVWFNQAHLFHVSSLPGARRRQLLALFGERDLPRHACFGDGSPIDDAMLDAVRGAYQRECLAFTWRAGDLLMVDNMLAAHGREAFRGERMVWFGMAEAHSVQS